MKKYFNILLSAFALVALSVACNKADPMDNGSDDQSVANPAAEMVTISATLTDAGTRVSFDPAFDNNNKPTGMAHTWEAGDMLRVFDASDHSVFEDYTLDQACVGSATGTFTGPGLSASSYDVTALPAGGPFTSGDTQIQASDGNTAHLEFIAGATGITDLTNITLNETSSIIGIIAKLPQGAAAGIDELVIETSMDGFATDPTTLTVQIATAGDTENDDILKVYANVPAGWSLAAGTEMFLRFNAPSTSHTTYTRYQVFSSALTSIPGKFNYIKMNCEHIDQYAGGSDAGTSVAPYQIADKYQMKAVRSLLVPNETRYFKMIDDVDLENEDWEPLNYDNSFTRKIEFDGQGHTISNLTAYGANSAPQGHNGYGYPSFAGVLYGTIKNVVIDGVTIEAGNDKAGSVGGYIGTSGKDGHCKGVTVKNVTISGTNYLGGFAGQVGNAGDTFENCHVIDASVTQSNTTVNFERSTGGFVGHSSTAASYTDCSVKASVMQAPDKTINAFGGFIGKADGGVSSFTNCQVLEGSVVFGHSNVGGFVGHNPKGSTYDNCTTSATVTGDGECVGGFVGKSEGGKFGNTTPCVASGTVSGTGVSSYYVGGFVGLSGATTYKACSYQGTSVSSDATESDKSAVTGGFCGRTNGVSGDSMIDCYVYNSASGTTVSAVLQRIGGFIGQSGSGTQTNLGTLSGCYVKNVTVSPGDKNCGGFVGVAYVPATNCYVEGGSVKAAGVSTGGFAGHVEKVNLTGCHSTMTIDANGKSDVGGLIGYLATAQTISKCYFSGSINANGQATGGLVGHTGNNVAAIIENCYSTGNLATTSGVQIHGGIVGELGTGGTVRNCYSTMSITGGRVLGGIVGRAAKGGWNYEAETNNTVSKCIAFNPSVSATQTGTYGSSGAIVGVTSIKNILEDCYRLYNMTFVNSNSWGNTMVDQVNSNGTNWTRDSSTGTGPGNQCAYFGRAAASDATVSSLAQTLGWSSTVWDFSSALPTLR